MDIFNYDPKTTYPDITNFNLWHGREYRVGQGSGEGNMISSGDGNGNGGGYDQLGRYLKID